MYPVSYPVASPILPPTYYYPPYLLGLRNRRARTGVVAKQEEKKPSISPTEPSIFTTDNNDTNELVKEMDAIYAEFQKEFGAPPTDIDDEFKALSADLDRELDEMFEAGYKQRDGESKAPVSKPVTTPAPVPVVQPAPAPEPAVQPAPVAQPTPGVKPTPVIKVEPLVTTPPPGFAARPCRESSPPRPKPPVSTAPATTNRDCDDQAEPGLAEPGLALVPLSPLRDNGLVQQRMRGGSCPFAVIEFFYVVGEMPRIRADLVLYYDGPRYSNGKARHMKPFDLHKIKQTVVLYTHDTDELLDGAADLLAYKEAGEYNLRHPDGIDTFLQDLKDLALTNDRAVCLSIGDGYVRFRCQITTV